MKKLKIIYEPRWRAAEYASLALNHFNGCEHGCVYCFNTRWAKQEYFSGAKMKEKALAKVVHDARILADAGDDREILLSFVGDPYQPAEADLGLTRAIIVTLMGHGLRFTVLTKGGTLAARDFDLLGNYDKARFGTSIVFHEAADLARFEPRAASYTQRVLSLQMAMERGIPTWVSMEPVIDPVQALRIIEWNHVLVDHWKVGKINMTPELAKIHPDLEKAQDWIKFRKDVVNLLNSVGADFYIKKSLSDL